MRSDTWDCGRCGTVNTVLARICAGRHCGARRAPAAAATDYCGRCGAYVAEGMVERAQTHADLCVECEDDL